MANIIIPKRSSVVGKIPLPGDLQVGELAVNLSDGLIFSKNAGGTVITLGGSGPLTSGAITTALGYTPANKAGDTFTGDVVINTKLAVGTSVTANTNYRFGKGISGGVSSSAFVQNGTVQSDVTTTAVSFNSQANTAAAPFTLTNYFHYYAQQGVIGAGSSITAVAGFYSDNTLLGATSTYGFRGGVGSGSGRWNLYMDGTADNYLAGNTGIGGSAAANAKLRVVGSGLSSEVARIEGGTLEAQMIINQTDDPATNTNRAQLSLRKNNIIGATISIDGATANRGVVYYDALSATGSHAFFVNSVDRLRINSVGAVSFSGSYGSADQILTSGSSASAPTWQGLKTINGNSILGTGDIVISGGGGGASVSVGDAAPSSPTANSLWWDSTIGQLRIYYNDGDTSQWVDAVNTQGLPGTNGLNGADGVGLPAGGTAGQILLKNSATNFDYNWSNFTPSLFGTQSANLVLAAPNNAAGTPTFRNLTLEDLPDAWVKKAVKCATTANITLSGTQTIDGIAVVAGDRVLVKNQTTASANGIYIVAAGAWTRSLDADTANEMAGALISVDQGTLSGGKVYDCDFRSTDTLGTTAIVFHKMVDDSSMPLYYRRNAALTLANVGTAVSWLGLTSGVTVAANTVYEFEGQFSLTTTGTTTHGETILFGLTGATVSNIAFTLFRATNANAAISARIVRSNVTTGVSVASNISASQDVIYEMRGTVAFTNGGQFNPQISFGTAPGGTSTVILGAYFTMTPIGTTGSNSSNGTWA